MKYGFIKEFEEIDWETSEVKSEEGQCAQNDDETGDAGTGSGGQIDNSLRTREIWNWIREETSS